MNTKQDNMWSEFSDFVDDFYFKAIQIDILWIDQLGSDRLHTEHFCLDEVQTEMKDYVRAFIWSHFDMVKEIRLKMYDYATHEYELVESFEG